MREIVFRAKSIEGEWVYGGGVVYTEGSGYILVGNDYDRISSGIYELHRVAHIVDPETVGEWTGLVDKNGTKVFEGDIGRYKQTDGAKRNGKPIICIGRVIYNEKTASYAVEGKDEEGVEYFDYFPIKDFEIIGNIHDNPELIKGGEV